MLDKLVNRHAHYNYQGGEGGGGEGGEGGRCRVMLKSIINC